MDAAQNKPFRLTCAAVGVTVLLLVVTGCHGPNYDATRARRDANIRYAIGVHETREARSDQNRSEVAAFCDAREAYHARRLVRTQGYLASEVERRDRQWHERQPMYRRWIDKAFEGDEDTARRAFFKIVE